MAIDDAGSILVVVDDAAGDDDTATGDDDTAGGDDDTAGDDDVGDDDSGSDNEPPELTFLSPAEEEEPAGALYDIRWHDEDPDDGDPTVCGDSDGDGFPDGNVTEQAGNPGVPDECGGGSLVDERTWGTLKAMFDGR